MKKVISLLLALLIVFISATNISDVMAVSRDYMAPWAEEEVGKAIENNLIPTDMQMDYLSTINREEFCILAIRMIEARAGKSIQKVLNDAGKKIAPYGYFSDCDTMEVRAASALGITNGTGAKTFSPKMKLTREQAAKFLTTTAIACGEDVELTDPDYADNSEIADWAKPYTGYLRKMGVLQGVDGNRFNPKGSYQRQQAFMTVYRLWDTLESIEPISNDDLSKMLNNAPYPVDYKAVFKGERKSGDETYQLRYEMFYSNKYGNERIRVDSFLDDRREYIMVYNGTADMTFLRMLMNTNYAQDLEGNWLTPRHLSELNFSDDLSGEKYTSVSAKIQTKNEEKFVKVHRVDAYGAVHDGTYSLKHKLPIKYVMTGEETNETWKLDSFTANVKIVDSAFDKEAISNDNFDTENLDLVSTLNYAPYEYDFDLKMEGVYKEKETNYESPISYFYKYRRNESQLTSLVEKMSEPATYLYMHTADLTKFMGAGDWEDLGEGNKLEFNYLNKQEYERLVNDEETMRHYLKFEMLEGEKKIHITIIKNNGDVKDYYYDFDTKIPYKYVSKTFGDKKVIDVTRVKLIVAE